MIEKSSMTKTPLTILMADDDADDRLLARDAMVESRVLNRLVFVEDGVELVDYLNGFGKYANRDLYPMPGLILLDLNMPKKDGREALQEIKSNPATRRIPVVILTTSKAEEDKLSNNSFLALMYASKVTW